MSEPKVTEADVAEAEVRWQQESNPTMALAREIARTRDARALHEQNIEYWQGVRDALVANNDRLRARVAELEALIRERVPYPWCPECAVQIQRVDEDGSCLSCGADPVPYVDHLRADNERLQAEVERLHNKLNADSQNFQIECLKAQLDATHAREVRLREALTMLATYEKDPPEVVKDDFAYDRLLAFVHEMARAALGE